jgi:hypothetical protein
MTTANEYERAAYAYVEATRALFAQDVRPAGARGADEAPPAEALADQAQTLTVLAAQLTQAAEKQLHAEDAQVRAQASTRLLAKALTDLEVSAYLLQAAEDEESGIEPSSTRGAERGEVLLADVEDYLQLLVGEAEAQFRVAERGEVTPTDVPTARVELSNAVVDALALISERATRTGQTTLAGLLGLGVSELAQAASVVGLDIADALGYGEKIGRLYNGFRDFAVQSYDSLLALLGKQLAQTGAQKVLDWLDKLKQGELFGDLLERLYETEPTAQELQKVVTESNAELDGFIASIDRVDGLTARYQQQTELAEKILRAVAFIGTLPLAVLPQPKVLLAAAYLLLAAYVILCGADYVDAPQLRLLNRVPGVRQVVEGQLVIVQE